MQQHQLHYPPVHGVHALCRRLVVPPVSFLLLRADDSFSGDVNANFSYECSAAVKQHCQHFRRRAVYFGAFISAPRGHSAGWPLYFFKVVCCYDVWFGYMRPRRVGVQASPPQCDRLEFFNLDKLTAPWIKILLRRNVVGQSPTDGTSCRIQQVLSYLYMRTYYETLSRTCRHNFLIMSKCNSCYDCECSNEPINTSEYCFDRWYSKSLSSTPPPM